MNYVATKMIAKMQALWATREQGATAVEYGLLVALIAAVIVAIVATLGTKILNAFTTVNSKLP
jgi:pilus assembly protein Flp/PilA